MMTPRNQELMGHRLTSNGVGEEPDVAARQRLWCGDGGGTTRCGAVVEEEEEEEVEGFRSIRDGGGGAGTLTAEVRPGGLLGDRRISNGREPATSRPEAGRRGAGEIKVAKI
jgi:hypothetical protein